MKRSSRTTSTSNRRPPRAVARLEAYHGARVDAWRQALAAARSRFAVEGIHQLRVEIKRLRALYRLAAFVAPTFSAKSGTRSLRELFRSAGVLRDIDIRQAIILPRLRSLDLREYFNQMKHDELVARESFLTVATPVRATALSGARKRVLAALSAMPQEEIRGRIDKRIRKLFRTLRAAVAVKRPDNEQLHAIRKVAKELRYALDVHQALFGVSADITRVATHLKRTYGHLGDWHDAVLTLETLKDFARKQHRSSLTAPDAYGELRTQLRQEVKRLRSAYEREREPLLRSVDRLHRKMQQAPALGHPGRSARSKTGH